MEWNNHIQTIVAMFSEVKVTEIYRMFIKIVILLCQKVYTSHIYNSKSTFFPLFDDNTLFYEWLK